MSFKTFLHEGSIINELGKYSTTMKAKKELRNKVHEYYPQMQIIEENGDFITTTSPGIVASEYNMLLQKYKRLKGFRELAEMVPKGMGAFEVLMSYLGDNITANGGGGSFDLNIGNSQIEVKMALKTRNNELYNFRLGTNSFAYLDKAKTDMQHLLLAMSFTNPNLVTTNIKEVINKSQVDILRNMDISNAVKSIDFKLNDKLFVLHNNTKIGKINAKKTIDNMKALVQGGEIKSVQTIDNELTRQLQKAKYGYYFFGETNKPYGMELFFQPTIGQVHVNNITQGQLRIRVEL